MKVSSRRTASIYRLGSGRAFSIPIYIVVTTMTTGSSKPDRAAQESEIEVTPEMHRAGLSVLMQEVPGGEHDAPEKIYRAMERARLQPN